MNHPNSGLVLRGMKTRKWNLCQRKMFLFYLNIFAAKCPHLVFESKQENKLANEYNKRLLISKKYCEKSF